MPAWAGAAALAVFFVILAIPQSIETGLRLRHPETFQQLTGAFRDDVRFLRSQPGSAICYHLDICYLAEKPMIYDPFNAGQALKTGAMTPDQVRNILQRENVRIIHASDTTAGSLGIPEPIAAEVAAEFEVVRQNANGVFYVRRAKAPAP